MPSLDFPPELLTWTIGLLIGFPLAMLVAGEAIVRLKRQGRPIVRTLRIVRSLVLPALATFLLLHKVVGLPRNDYWVRGLETLVWIFLVHGALSFINDVVFASARPGSWQSHVPKLFVDLVRTLLVLVAAGVVLKTVWGVNLEQYAAALGVGSIVIGLALQEPLGNVFAGMMLLFERPVATGDWIQIDSAVGKVVEITWRAVYILTPAGEMRIVPNSSLYKGSFSNLSRAGGSRTEVVDVGFSYDDAPNTVKDALSQVLAGIENIVDDPAPTIELTTFDGTVRYRVSFTVARHEEGTAARNEFLTRLWYAARRRGLSLNQPTRRADANDRADLAARGITKLSELLRAFPQFHAMSDELLARIEPKVSVLTYAHGERLIAEGERLSGLHLVLAGQAKLAVHDRSGREHEFARVGRGEYFGESTLLSGQASEIAVTALEDLQVIVIRPEALQALIEESPRLGRELGNALDIRRRAAHSARRSRGPAPAHI